MLCEVLLEKAWEQDCLTLPTLLDLTDTEQFKYAKMIMEQWADSLHYSSNLATLRIEGQLLQSGRCGQLWNEALQVLLDIAAW